MEMSDKVVENLARKYENVREGVKSVMGGKVLEHEAKTILREGWKQGEDYGIKKGKLEQAKQTALNLKAMGMSDESIAMAVGVGVSAVREWFSENKD